MTTRSVESDADLEGVILFMQGYERPFTVNITKGKHRSTEQNRLQREWISQIAAQRDDQTAEEWRGYCKLTMGVPILRAENDAFREAYDKHIRPLPYETKLAMMQAPLDWPVTRMMTVKQKTAYLDHIQRHFAEQGVILTESGG